MIESKKIRWTDHVACRRYMRNVYKMLVGKPEGKKTIRRPWHRWEDNIRMDLREIE
jgi:hypothetical protein